MCGHVQVFYVPYLEDLRSKGCAVAMVVPIDVASLWSDELSL